MSSSMNNIATLYHLLKLDNKGKLYGDSALKLALKLGYPEHISNAAKTLSHIDSALGDMSGALAHYKQHIMFRDSINNVQTRKAATRNQLKYEFDKKEAVLQEQQEKERALAQEHSRVQQIVIWCVVGGLCLVMGFAGFVFRTLKTTRLQKHVIEEKQKEIMDSIFYARRIQRSLVTSEKYIAKELARLRK